LPKLFVKVEPGALLACGANLDAARVQGKTTRVFEPRRESEGEASAGEGWGDGVRRRWARMLTGAQGRAVPSPCVWPQAE